MHEQKFNLCVTSIIKNEALYIEEWLCYHRALGVDHFFIFDNNSEDNIEEVLKPYINHGIASLILWPMQGGQIDAYNYSSHLFGRATEWMAYIDLDEFIVLKNARSLPEYLQTLEGADQVLIPWRNFGFSGHEKRPTGLVIESYTQAQDIPPEGFTSINAKAIVRSSVVKRVTPHFAFTTSQATVDGLNRRVTEDFFLQAPNYERIQINHYYTKSYEEFEAKLGRGQAGGGAEKGKIPFNRPGFATSDLSALRNLDATRERMALMHSLSANPFRYGGQMAAGGPQRRDPFLWAAKVAISNYLGDAPKISIGMKVDFENLSKHGDVLARASDSGRVPSLGGFRHSIHVADFVRRLGGDLVCDLAADIDLRTSVSPDAGLERGKEAITLRFPSKAATLTAATGRRDASRCYCVGYAMRTADPLRLEVALSCDNENGRLPLKTVEMPSAGYYCGILELNKDPIRAGDLRVSFANASGEVEIFDLFAVAYG